MKRNGIKFGGQRAFFRAAVPVWILPFALLVAPVVAQAPALAMLDRIERGLWDVRYRDGTPAGSVCVRTGREFIQLRHPDRTCSQYVVEDSQSQVSVQYTCPGAGYGLTNIRRESGSLLQIKGSGLTSSQPFDFTAEARKVGPCR